MQRSEISRACEALVPTLCDEHQLTEGAARAAILAALGQVGDPQGDTDLGWAGRLHRRAAIEARGRRVFDAVYGPALRGALSTRVDPGAAEDAAITQVEHSLGTVGAGPRNPAAYAWKAGRYRAATETRTAGRRARLALQEVRGAAVAEVVVGLPAPRVDEQLEAAAVARPGGRLEWGRALVDSFRARVEAARAEIAHGLCAERRAKDTGRLVASLVLVGLAGSPPQAELAARAGVTRETFSRYSTPYRTRLATRVEALAWEICEDEELSDVGAVVAVLRGLAAAEGVELAPTSPYLPSSQALTSGSPQRHSSETSKPLSA